MVERIMYKLNKKYLIDGIRCDGKEWLIVNQISDYLGYSRSAYLATMFKAAEVETKDIHWNVLSKANWFSNSIRHALFVEVEDLEAWLKKREWTLERVTQFPSHRHILSHLRIPRVSAPEA